MAPTSLKELQERFSLCHVRLTSCMINLISVMHDQSSLGHVQSTFSLSCTINLLSVVYDQPSLVMYDQASLGHVRSTFSLSCTINLLSVMYNQPSLCHVRSTFSLSCTINLLSVMYDQPSLVMYDQASLCHVRSTFSRHVRSTFSRHVRSTFSRHVWSTCSLSCTINLLSVMYCQPSVFMYDQPYQNQNQNIYCLSTSLQANVFVVHSQCTTSSSRVVPPSSSPYLSRTINFLSVTYDQPSFCHVRTTLSCTIIFLPPLRSTWLTEGEWLWTVGWNWR